MFYFLTSVGDLFAHLRKRHPWADPKIVKVILSYFFYVLLNIYNIIVVSDCLTQYA